MTPEKVSPFASDLKEPTSTKNLSPLQQVLCVIQDEAMQHALFNHDYFELLNLIYQADTNGSYPKLGIIKNTVDQDKSKTHFKDAWLAGEIKKIVARERENKRQQVAQEKQQYIEKLVELTQQFIKKIIQSQNKAIESSDDIVNAFNKISENNNDLDNNTLKSLRKIILSINDSQKSLQVTSHAIKNAVTQEAEQQFEYDLRSWDTIKSIMLEIVGKKEREFLPEPAAWMTRSIGNDFKYPRSCHGTPQWNQLDTSSMNTVLPHVFALQGPNARFKETREGFVKGLLAAKPAVVIALGNWGEDFLAYHKSGDFDEFHIEAGSVSTSSSSKKVTITDTQKASHSFELINIRVKDNYPIFLDNAALNQFYKMYQQSKQGQPIVAHCTSGVGRTGEALLFFLLMDALNKDERLRIAVDRLLSPVLTVQETLQQADDVVYIGEVIRRCLFSMRKNRPQVQVVEQYYASHYHLFLFRAVQLDYSEQQINELREHLGLIKNRELWEGYRLGSLNALKDWSVDPSLELQDQDNLHPVPAPSDDVIKPVLLPPLTNRDLKDEFLRLSDITSGFNRMVRQFQREDKQWLQQHPHEKKLPLRFPDEDKVKEKIVGLNKLYEAMRKQFGIKFKKVESSREVGQGVMAIEYASTSIKATKKKEEQHTKARTVIEKLTKDRYEFFNDDKWVLIYKDKQPLQLSAGKSLPLLEGFIKEMKELMLFLNNIILENSMTDKENRVFTLFRQLTTTLGELSELSSQISAQFVGREAVSQRKGLLTTAKSLSSMFGGGETKPRRSSIGGDTPAPTNLDQPASGNPNKNPISKVTQRMSWLAPSKKDDTEKKDEQKQKGSRKSLFKPFGK